jgi:hypothetical protein
MNAVAEGLQSKFTAAKSRCNLFEPPIRWFGDACCFVGNGLDRSTSVGPHVWQPNQFPSLEGWLAMVWLLRQNGELILNRYKAYLS